jgi:hypothetical protein
MTVYVWPKAPCHPNPDGSEDHYYREGAHVGDPCYCGAYTLGDHGEDEA